MKKQNKSPLQLAGLLCSNEFKSGQQDQKSASRSFQEQITVFSFLAAFHSCCASLLKIFHHFPQDGIEAENMSLLLKKRCII